MRSLFLLMILFHKSHGGELNHVPVVEGKTNHVVEVSWSGKRAEVSLELLEKIHQNSGNRVITLITECVSYQTCEDQVELWSNRLLNLKRLNQYGVGKWQLKPEGFSGPFGSTGIRKYREKFTR